MTRYIKNIDISFSISIYCTIRTIHDVV